MILALIKLSIGVILIFNLIFVKIINSVVLLNDNIEVLE